MNTENTASGLGWQGLHHDLGKGHRNSREERILKHFVNWQMASQHFSLEKQSYFLEETWQNNDNKKTTIVFKDMKSNDWTLLSSQCVRTHTPDPQRISRILPFQVASRVSSGSEIILTLIYFKVSRFSMCSLFHSLQTAPVMSPCRSRCPHTFGRQLYQPIPGVSAMETRKSLVLSSMKKPGQTGPWVPDQTSFRTKKILLLFNLQ